MSNLTRNSKAGGRWFTVAGFTFAGIVLAVLVAATVWQGNVHKSDTSAAEKHSGTAALLRETGKEADVAAALLQQYVKTGDPRLVPQMQAHTTLAVKTLTDAVRRGTVADLSGITSAGGSLADGLGQVVALRQAGDVQGAAAALRQLDSAFKNVSADREAATAMELQEASNLQSSANKADDTASWLLIASIVWGAALGVGVTVLVARSMFGRRVSKTPSTI